MIEREREREREREKEREREREIDRKKKRERERKRERKTLHPPSHTKLYNIIIQKINLVNIQQFIDTIT